LRETVSRSRRSTEFLGSESRSEHFSVEPAVMPTQIEQLPDLAGYLKQASDPRWQSVRLAAVRQWRERQPVAPASAAPSRGREEHYRE